MSAAVRVERKEAMLGSARRDDAMTYNTMRDFGLLNTLEAVAEEYSSTSHTVVTVTITWNTRDIDQLPVGPYSPDAMTVTLAGPVHDLCSTGPPICLES